MDSRLNPFQDKMEKTLNNGPSNNGALYIEISDCDKEITFTDDYGTTRTEPIFEVQGYEIYAQCEEFMSLTNVEHIYITKYNLSDIKKAINNTDPSVNNLSSDSSKTLGI